MLISMELEVLRSRLNRIKNNMIYDNELVSVTSDQSVEVIKQIDSLIKIFNSKPKYYPNIELLVEEYKNTIESPIINSK